MYAWQPSPEISLICIKLLETAKSGLSNKDKYLQSTIRFMDKYLSLSSSIAAWSTDARKAFGCVLEFEVGKLSTSLSSSFLFVGRTKKQGYDNDSGVEVRAPSIIEEFFFFLLKIIEEFFSCWQAMCGDYGMKTLLTDDRKKKNAVVFVFCTCSMCSLRFNSWNFSFVFYISGPLGLGSNNQSLANLVENNLESNNLIEVTNLYWILNLSFERGDMLPPYQQLGECTFKTYVVFFFINLIECS